MTECRRQSCSDAETLWAEPLSMRAARPPAQARTRLRGGARCLDDRISTVLAERMRRGSSMRLTDHSDRRTRRSGRLASRKAAWAALDCGRSGPHQLLPGRSTLEVVPSWRSSPAQDRMDTGGESHALA
jgi:hypothetical protein